MQKKRTHVNKEYYWDAASSVVSSSYGKRAWDTNCGNTRIAGSKQHCL